MLENYFISVFFNAEILLKKTANILLENCQKLLENCQTLTVKFTLLDYYTHYNLTPLFQRYGKYLFLSI